MAEPVVAEPTPSPAAAPVVQPVPDQIAAPAAEAKPIEAAPAKPVIPEKYEFKAPDGMELNQPLLDAVGPVFKDLGLSQDQASKLFDTYNAATQAAEAASEKAFVESMAQRTKEYQATVRKDWGANYEVNLATAQRGLARVMSNDAKAILDETGLGNHPEFLKAFLAVGKMVSEDTPPVNGAPNGRKSNADVFYGSTN